VRHGATLALVFLHCIVRCDLLSGLNVIFRPNGETVVVNVRVWNETVSNLTLMALGSSAPEILLSIIEVVGNRFNAGDLGPGTIVGSAAFNLFVITGLCVTVIPNGEVRRIKHLRVFFITATWSIFAYLWLYVIIALSSPERVDVWEAVLTFIFFPATVVTAYVVDKKIFFDNFLSRRIRARIAGSTAPTVEGRENLELGIPAVNGVSSSRQDLNGTAGAGAGGALTDDKDLDEFEK
jgi:solute carrier family 8 (sodium/calcium exchanger)